MTSNQNYKIILLDWGGGLASSLAECVPNFISNLERIILNEDNLHSVRDQIQNQLNSIEICIVYIEKIKPQLRIQRQEIYAILLKSIITHKNIQRIIYISSWAALNDSLTKYAAEHDPRYNAYRTRIRLNEIEISRTFDECLEKLIVFRVPSVLSLSTLPKWFTILNSFARWGIAINKNNTSLMRFVCASELWFSVPKLLKRSPEKDKPLTVSLMPSVTWREFWLNRADRAKIYINLNFDNKILKSILLLLVVLTRRRSSGLIFFLKLQDQLINKDLCHTDLTRQISQLAKIRVKEN